MANRSEESKARQNEYTRQWKLRKKDPEAMAQWLRKRDEAKPTGRSEKSKEQQREYARQWRASQRGQDYHRDWRKEHREQENRRSREWKASHRDEVRLQRQRYEEAHPRVVYVQPLPDKFIGHDFFETARFICGPKPYWDFSVHWEDRMAAVVLALCEGRDPEEAYLTEYRWQQGWVHETGPIYDNVDIRDHDQKVVFTRTYRSAHD